MNKFTLALAALGVASASFAQDATTQIDARTPDEPTTATMKPAVSELVDGGHYYIYDADSGRYGFMNDADPTGLSRIMGNRILNNAAYGQLPEAKYVWTATKNANGNWEFQNEGTSHYYGDSNNASETPAGFVLEARDGQTNVFDVKNVNNNKYWNADYPVNGGIALSYWVSGHPIMFYAAVAEGDAWNFDAIPAYTITCNFTFEGITIATETFVGANGDSYTFNAPRYYQCEPISGIVNNKNTVYTVECTRDLPFVLSSSLEDATWMGLFMHSSYHNIELTYDDDEQNVIGVQGTNSNDLTTPFNDNQLFALVGTLDGGFKIYNKASGKALVKNGDNTELAEDDADATVWLWGASNATPGNSYFVVRPSGQNTCLNIQPGQGVWTLKYWWDADQGSTLWALGLAQPQLNGYLAIFNAAIEAAAGNEEMIALATQGKTLAEGLDPWSELPAETVEQLNAIKTQLELAVAISTKKAALQNYLNASYTGVEIGAGLMSQFDMCTTMEELDRTYTDLLSAAMGFMQSDMESGFVMKNRRSGYYLNGESTADPDDDENILTTYKAQTTNGLNAYWVAEFTDNGNSVMPVDRTFYLRNVITNTYMGIQTNNNTPVPVVPAANKAEEAALIKVVAAETGFQFLITNGDVANNFINTNTLEGAQPVVWQQPNDGGAYWIASMLPSFTEDQPAEVAFTGDTTTGEWGETVYSSVNAIEIKVPVGAKPVDFGKIRAYVLDQDWNEVTIFEASAATALEGAEPTEGTVEVVTWDADFNMNVTNVPVDVYTIMLNPARTNAGEYRINIGAAAFELEAEDGAKTYSGELNNYAVIESAAAGFEIEVTPAAGTVEGLTSITLNSATGMAANANYTGDNITLKYNIDTVILDLNGEAMAQYDSFSFDDMTAPYYTIPVNKTEVGTYNFVIPEGFFENDNMETSAEVLITWTIEEMDGINEITNVTVNGRTVYDLQGRRVANPSKGLYIINGQKTLVK